MKRLALSLGALLLVAALLIWRGTCAPDFYD